MGEAELLLELYREVLDGDDVDGSGVKPGRWKGRLDFGVGDEGRSGIARGGQRRSDAG